MDITVIIPTRKRTVKLAAALNSLVMTESRKNKIKYVIACDVDDTETIAFCEKIPQQLPHINLTWHVGERPKSLGSLVNQMAEGVRGDVYVAFCDDLLCMTMNWDEIIWKAVKKTPHGVFFWKMVRQELAFFTIVTEKWRKAAGGIFTDLYPYWFDDLCLIEWWIVATDSIPIILEDLILLDRPTDTMRMRELPFWTKFYTKTRPLRILQGIEIAKKLGLPAPQYMPQKHAKVGLEAMEVERLQKIEAEQGEPNTPPDASYIEAKNRALAILEQIERVEKNAA